MRYGPPWRTPREESREHGASPPRPHAPPSRSAACAEGGPNYSPEEEELFRATIGKPVVKQPLTWDVALARGELAPPLVDARDAFRKRLQGVGRREFFERHWGRLMRTFLFFGDTERGGHFKASDEKALVRPGAGWEWGGGKRAWARSDNRSRGGAPLPLSLCARFCSGPGSTRSHPQDYPGDVTQNFNEVLRMFERLVRGRGAPLPGCLVLGAVVPGGSDARGQTHQPTSPPRPRPPPALSQDIYNADINPTKLKVIASKVVGADDVLGQEHPNVRSPLLLSLSTGTIRHSPLPPPRLSPAEAAPTDSSRASLRPRVDPPERPNRVLL